MTIRWFHHRGESPTILINPSNNNQTLNITNNEELFKYLKENLDININLDLHLKNGNGLTLNFKKDLTDIENKEETRIKAATRIQAEARRNFASKLKHVLRSRKPRKISGRNRNFFLSPYDLSKEQRKLLEIHQKRKGKGKKKKSTKRKGKKKYTKRKKSGLGEIRY